MTDKAIEQRNKRVLIYLIICVIAIALYRIVMIAVYLSKYIDDDQALMWYGTVLASNGGIKEPHFLGQKYGSMIESIVAVPLYDIGIPLEWALPIVSFLLWFFPFVLLAMLCRKKAPVISFCILLSSLLYHWDYDILTNIPRAFIGGFPFAFLGLVLIVNQCKTSKPWELFFGIILMGIGYLYTVTSITVSALAVLYLLMYRRQWCKNDWWALLSGTVIVLGVLYYCNHLFYKINPDYWVFGENETIHLSWRAFKYNVRHCLPILRSYSLVNIGKIPASLLIYCMATAGWMIQLIKQKKYKFVFIVFCALAGSCMFITLRRTLQFDNTLWYSASRIYLYFPYVVITVLYLYANAELPKQITDDSYYVLNKWNIKFSTLCKMFVLSVVLISAFKTYRFNSKVINYPELYKDSNIISLCSVEDIYRISEELRNLASENDTDIIISINHTYKDGKIESLPKNKCIDYATSAVNYGQYTEYRTYFDRRTDVYLRLKQRILHNEKVAFVLFEDGQIADAYFVTLDNTDCISYLEEQMNVTRRDIKILPYHRI